MTHSQDENRSSPTERPPATGATTEPEDRSLGYADDDGGEGSRRPPFPASRLRSRLRRFGPTAGSSSRTTLLTGRSRSRRSSLCNTTGSGSNREGKRSVCWTRGTPRASAACRLRGRRPGYSDRRQRRRRRLMAVGLLRKAPSGLQRDSAACELRVEGASSSERTVSDEQRFLTGGSVGERCTRVPARVPRRRSSRWRNATAGTVFDQLKAKLEGGARRPSGRSRFEHHRREGERERSIWAHWRACGPRRATSAIECRTYCANMSIRRTGSGTAVAMLWGFAGAVVTKSATLAETAGGSSSLASRPEPHEPASSAPRGDGR